MNKNSDEGEGTEECRRQKEQYVNRPLGRREPEDAW